MVFEENSKRVLAALGATLYFFKMLLGPPGGAQNGQNLQNWGSKTGLDDYMGPSWRPVGLERPPEAILEPSWDQFGPLGGPFGGAFGAYFGTSF